MSQILLKSALWYKDKMGYSVIPIKPNKRPYIMWQPYQKKQATQEEIEDWWEEYPDAMIGIVTGAISNLDVIDVDTSEGERNIMQIITPSFKCPKSVTPRGGAHLYFLHTVGMTNNAGVVPGADLRAEGGYIIAPPSTSEKGIPYRWDKNFKIGHVPTPLLPAAYIEYINENAATFDPDFIKRKTGSSKLFSKGRRDEDLFHVAHTLVKGGMERDATYDILRRLAASCSPPFPPKDSDIKVASAMSRALKKDTTLAQDIREWVKRATGTFRVAQLYNEFSISLRADKQNVSQILSRLIDSKVLAREGTQWGTFRKVDSDCIVMDWRNAPNVPVKIDFPLFIEDWVEVYPGNGIIIAGESQGGKTAWLLRLAIMNITKGYHVRYINNEMAEQELKKRIKLFRDIADDSLWDKIEFIYRTEGNFEDVTLPNAFNIYDYLEETDEPFRVPGRIKRIVNTLESGVAVIALQKPHGRDWGRGGEATIALSRLYLSLFKQDYKSGTPNRMKIVKGKAWATATNPDDMICDFRLKEGSIFEPKGSWYREAKKKGSPF